MEDGLVPPYNIITIIQMINVLILVVMEDGLVHDVVKLYVDTLHVLILVVMEDGLVLDLIRHYCLSIS